MMCSHTPDTTRPIANPEKPLTKPPAKAAKTKSVKTHLSIGRSPQKEVTHTWMDIHLVGRLRGPHGRQIGSLIEFPNTGSSSIHLFRFSVSDLIKQRYTVGLGPQPNLAGIGESGILDLKQLFAVEGYAEARGFEVDAQAVPGVGRDRNANSIAPLPAYNVERASDTVDGLIENDIVFKRIGPGHIVIVRVFRPPDNAGGAVLGSRDGLEPYLHKAVPDAGVVLQEQRVGCPAGLLEYLRF